jgi:putative redox protein
MAQKASITSKWLKNMAFETVVDGHSVIVDASMEAGGEDKGPRPKLLMLVALAGCTGMDVVSMLKKMRVEIDDLNIRVEGELTETHPKHFIAMHLVYEFTGKNLPLDKLERAVELSQTTYCGVSAVYQKCMPVDYEIVVKEV